MKPLDDLPVVGEAEWTPPDGPPLRIRLVAGPHHFGTGDFEDPGDVAENPAGESFVLAFDDTTLAVASIDEAKAIVESRFPGARWLKPGSGSEGS